MAPGHLVEKWKQEIEDEIPGSKATILRNLSQIIELKERGRKRNGKEFFILSKDFAKLGEQFSPIPHTVRKVFPSICYCKDCFSEEGGNVMVYKHTKRDGSTNCSRCNGNNFVKQQVTSLGRFTGMICPNCNELLLTNNSESVLCGDKDPYESTWFLTPGDFASRTNVNEKCYFCGAPLWGANTKPIDCGGEFSKWTNRPSKWKKISFFKNQHRKSRGSAFVLKGYEESLNAKTMVIDPEEMPNTFGPRKTAPARFIKKYLKGYFDFCILDEAHKYEGKNSAQSTAAHALIKASDFTMCLTGTIANGTAESFFALLYMLEPKRMIEKGFRYCDTKKFIEQYGSIETVYEYPEDLIEYNSSSRGKQVRMPKPKPGISPMIFVDFLLDRSVFLDIVDLSKFLPPLNEKVITCELPDEVYHSYNHTIQSLKEAIHTKEGRAAMTQILTFGLSYPDKPYGRKPITSAYHEDEIIATIDNYPVYEHGELLPKEEEMVKIIKKEINEGRNCFVYASYTGTAETNVTQRYKDVIERYCNLTGRVAIISPTSPAASEREAWIQKRAADGIKVFITNPKCVETGLDFCFKYNGKTYNYPTLIFMQMSYEMSVIWQASRRHYRLNQREECRTYYLAYENTLQTAALEIMAAKQVATSAIQGKFSSEGLSAMAKGVDTRTQLAAALSKNDMGNRKSLENMFDALNQTNNADDGKYSDYVPPKTYYEVVGKEEEIVTSSDVQTEFDLSSLFEINTENEYDLIGQYVAKPVEETKQESEQEIDDVSTSDDLFSAFETALISDFGMSFDSLTEGLFSTFNESESMSSISIEPIGSFEGFMNDNQSEQNDSTTGRKKNSKRKKTKEVEGQMSFFNFG